MSGAPVRSGALVFSRLVMVPGLTTSSPVVFPPFAHSLFRPLLLVALLIAELFAASVAFDTRDLEGKGALLSVVASIAPKAIRFGLTLFAAAAVFGFFRWRQLATELAAEMNSIPVRRQWLAAHGAAVVLSVPLMAALFWTKPGAGASSLLFLALAGAGAFAVWAAGRALVPWGAIALAGRSLGAGWLLAAMVAVAASFGGNLAQAFWKPSAKLTFTIVESLLGVCVPRVYSRPEMLDIGTDRFYVNIAPDCSGYEGMGLVVAFASGWLWFFRQEYRFPASLVLIPVSATAMWLLNSVRIAALILIGHNGAVDVALGGFHSQAGWLAFIAIAVALCVLSRRMPVFAMAAGRAADVAPANDVAPYLMPFLAILAASMLSKTLSGAFEWLYPIRILAALAALWFHRKSYRTIQWRPGVASLVAGIAVFALWIGLDRSPNANMSPELAAMPLWLRSLWLGMRIFGAVVTVPIAEELAFRGFLFRRLVNPDFTSVSWRGFPMMPAILSSVAFGAMHGSRWIEGTLAGFLYGWVMTRKGSLGDAVAAHAATNAILAAWVLATGQWQYW